MRNRRTLALILAVSMACSLTACSNKQANTNPTEEAIELIDPVDTAASSEKAAYRNLYDYKVLTGFVYPYIEEYSFDIDASLKEYLVTPGDSVKRGDVLINADSGNLAKQIESMEEQIENAKKSYDENMENRDKTIQDYRDQIQELNDTKGVWGVVMSRIGDDPSSAYQIANIENQIAQIDKKIPQIEVYIEEQEMYKRQETELYNLDAAQRVRQLENLKSTISSYSIKSNIDGTVVSANEKSTGSWVGKDTALIAIGDPSKKILRCEYVDKLVIAKCDDYYVVVNGKRYEAEHVAYSSAEYEKLSSQNSVVYSSFIIDDPNDEIEIGSLASLAQIYSRKENVLTVPKNAIHKDSSGQYVYCIEEGTTVTAYVKTGVNDSVYTEIISGLNEGDEVLLTASNTYGSKTATLSTRDFSGSYTGSGYITYPMETMVYNEIEYGTIYFVEYQVMMYAHVDAGDVICTVTVKGDDIALKEKEDELRRHRERLAELLSVEEDKRDKNSIEYREKMIENLEEQLGKLKKAYATTEIIAPVSGIVSGLNYIQEGSVLNKGTAVASIADEDRCYIAVKDEKRNLILGSQVEVSYTDENGNPAVAVGTVVNANNAALSRNLISDYAYIQVPAEAARNMPAITFNSMFYDRTRFEVTTVTRKMEGVLAIPRSAVKDINGKTYAFIINDDGTVKAQCFVPGGSDANYYWVMEGLEEGMTVCSE